MTDILIDELQNHLYLKTFYSDSRWRAYMPGQRDRESGLLMYCIFKLIDASARHCRR